MKFLLAAVNAKYIHSNPAVYSLKAYAGRERQEQVEIAEYTINQRMEQILADLYRRKPDVAAFSCYIWNMTLIEELAAELHKLLPRLPIWFGGPEVSYEPRLVLDRLPFSAGIMIGEGEETFLELLKYYDGTSKEKELRKIRGLYLPEGPTGEQDAADFSGLPFFYENLDKFENRIVYYESSRGCPFCCSYCLSSIDRSVRLRELDRVKKELQFFLDRKTPQVKFIDRTFNCSHEHALGIWNYLREHDNGVTNFHFEIAADLLTREELALLGTLRPGLVQLEIGVQSVNPDTLRAINRKTDLTLLKENVAALRAGRNIHIHLDLIAGLPFEDYASFKNSFNEVYEMRPEQLQLGFLKVLKGSEMYRRAAEYGINYTSKPPYEVLYSKWLPYESVLRLKQVEEMVELYYNSGQHTHTLAVLEGAFASPFELFEALADYYDKRGYFLNSPARAYRYHVLLAFAREADPSRGELYRQLCTFDMYLREPMKSRPDFAPERPEYRERIRRFYEKEENNRCYLSDYKGYTAKQMMRMTHMEVFDYPVWKEGGRMDGGPLRETLVLFDYKKRSPLNREAAYYVIEDGSGEA